MTPDEVAQKQLDAYNARDLEAFLAVYDSEVELAKFPSGQVIATGRAAIRPLYAALFVRNPELHVELLSRVVKGRFVIDHEDVTSPAGKETKAVAIYEINDGLIQRVWFLS